MAVTNSSSGIAPRAIVLLAIITLLGALAASDAAHAVLVRLIESGRGVIAAHPTAGPVAFIGLAMLSALLAFFSSAILVPTAVMAWGPTVTTMYLLAGWLLGGLLAYTLARTVGRPALRWIAPRRHLDEDAVRMTGGLRWRMVLLFQLVLPSELPGFVLGLAQYPVWRYLAALTLAELPYAIGTVLLGVSFVERRVGVFLALGIAAVVAVAVLAPALRRRLA